MKVVLTRDVKKIGRAHDVVTVADGHALNFLIPGKMAIVATQGAIVAAESRRKASEADRTGRAQAVADRLAALAQDKPVITKKANEQGHLFEAVSAAEIAAVTQIPEDAIEVAKPIKDVGTHEITVSFGDDTGTFALEVVAE